jgi:DNA (cytosine-5)-methyltransferase 1
MTIQKQLTFIDLFAGIGGIRIGFEEFFGRCLFSSEFDKQALTTKYRFVYYIII